MHTQAQSAAERGGTGEQPHYDLVGYVQVQVATVFHQYLAAVPSQDPPHMLGHCAGHRRHRPHSGQAPGFVHFPGQLGDCSGRDLQRRQGGGELRVGGDVRLQSCPSLPHRRQGSDVQIPVGPQVQVGGVELHPERHPAPPPGLEATVESLAAPVEPLRSAAGVRCHPRWGTVPVHGTVANGIWGSPRLNWPSSSHCLRMPAISRARGTLERGELWMLLPFTVMLPLCSSA